MSSLIRTLRDNNRAHRNVIYCFEFSRKCLRAYSDKTDYLSWRWMQSNFPQANRENVWIFKSLKHRRITDIFSTHSILINLGIVDIWYRYEFVENKSFSINVLLKSIFTLFTGNFLPHYCNRDVSHRYCKRFWKNKFNTPESLDGNISGSIYIQRSLA